MSHQFDPEGAGYDMETAIAAGLKPEIDPRDGKPHWPSRHPETGQVLKGRLHPTWDKAIQADEQLGYQLAQGSDKKYYSYKPFAGLDNIPIRQPHPSELDFFKQNDHVGGMAAPDDQVVLNPFSLLTSNEKASVATNEKVRVWLRQHGEDPQFSLTKEQQAQFGDYGSPQDIRHTIIARGLSGDPSAGELTEEQQRTIDRIRQLLQDVQVP